MTTQESCRFVLWDRPPQYRFPVVNRLTDKQAIAMAHRFEPVDRSLAISFGDLAAILTIMQSSPDHKTIR